MQIIPAIHMGVLGVYPDAEIDADILESLTGSRASAQCHDVVMQGRLGAAQIARLLENKGNEIDLLDFEQFQIAQAAQNQISHTAGMRMRAAYALAARRHWIKPVTGIIYVAEPIALRPDVNLREAIERAYVEAFFNFVGQEKQPDLTLPFAEDQTIDNGLTGVAHIRCVVDGQLYNPTAFSPAKYLFRSLSGAFMEPPLDEAMFNLEAVDTVAHCLNNRSLRTSRFMGYGDSAPPPSLIMP